jgi:predicted MFS family arabinose efflux permease
MAFGLLGVGAGATLAAGSVHPAMFALALVILAQSKVMFDLGLGAWMSDRVPFERRSRVMGLTETSWALGLLLGVSLMGLVTALTNWRVGFGAGAVAVVAMAAIVARGIAPDSGVHTSASRIGSVRGPDRRHWVMLAGTFCLMAASQSLFVTFGSWLEDTFSFSPAGISAVVFGLGAGELVASVTSARRTDAWGKERSAAAGAAAMVVASIGLAMAHEHLAFGLLFLALAIAGFEFAIVSAIPLGTELVAGSPARGMALMLGAGTLGRALASIPATRLYARHGIGWPAAMCAALASATAATMWLVGTRRQDQPR